MQITSHLLEMMFETSILLTVLFSLASWLGGRRLTNRQMLSVFAFSLAIGLVIHLLVGVSIYVFLIGYLVWKVFPLKRVSEFVRRRHP